MEEQNNEQPIVTVSSHVTHMAYVKFFWRWMLRYRKSFLVLLAVALLLLALSFWENLTFESLFLARQFLIFLPWIGVFYMVSRYGSHREMYEAKTAYAFYENRLRSHCVVLGTMHYKVTPYERFAAAVETKSAFYLMLPARKIKRYSSYRGDNYDPDPYGTSVILDKKHLTEEQATVLRELFTRKFGEKFKAL